MQGITEQSVSRLPAPFQGASREAHWFPGAHAPGYVPAPLRGFCSMTQDSDGTSMSDANHKFDSGSDPIPIAIPIPTKAAIGHQSLAISVRVRCHVSGVLTCGI